MPPHIRRLASWISLTTLLIAAALAYRLLPGAGGPAEEIRWLLACDYLTAGRSNQAAALLNLAEADSPGTRGAIFRQLLADADRRVVMHAMLLASDELRRSGPRLDVAEALAAWLSDATVADLVATLPHSLKCLALAVAACEGANERDDAWSLTKLPGRHARWFVAANLEQDIHTRLIADAWLLESLTRPASAAAVESRWQAALERLRAIDGPGRTWASGRDAPLLPPNWAARLSSDDLAALLDDPIEQVRWGAGRILAAAGDARGLPVLREWLQSHPRRTPEADAVMSGIYGPEWRDLHARSSPTGQPGPGDGGG
jgi:hypothetical protein